MEKMAVGLDEAAKMTSVSRFTLRRQIKRGVIKVARVGRRLVIPISELEKLVSPSVSSNESHPEQPKTVQRKVMSRGAK
jgi:excisionase family DNA binding protein